MIFLKQIFPVKNGGCVKMSPMNRILFHSLKIKRGLYTLKGIAANEGKKITPLDW
jgi:hypothetical protein